MTVYTLKQLSDIGVISQQLKRVLVLLGCSTSEDMIELSNDWIKVDYIEKSHKLKEQLFKAISDIEELDSILPEFVASANTTPKSKKTSEKKFNKRTFKVGDYTEHLLEQSSTPIKVEELLQKIKYYLPETYIESIRANLNGDPQERFVFFLDGYVGLKRKEYDKRFHVYSVEKKKIQYAEQRIMEFLSFMEEKHRSPQPHGLEAEESLYRWYLDFTKSSAKELAGLRTTFQQYLKEYDQWMFTPFEYSYKRNCDQVKWYVDENLELPTQEDEPELATWFNSQLECYEKHKDKRKRMFIDLMTYLEDYGMHFYDAKSAKGKAAKKEVKNVVKKTEESPLEKYSRLFESIKERNYDKAFVVQKALLLIAIGNLVQNNFIRSNEITLTNDLLMEFADVCLDIMGTASSYNIAIPFYYLSDESFWSLIPQMWMACEDSDEVEPTYDYIEKTYSCAIIDQDLFGLLSDEEGFSKFKETLVEGVIRGKRAPVVVEEDVADESVILKVSHPVFPKERKKGSKGPRTNLRVLFDGETFENEKAVTTFIEVMKRIGLERVRSLGLMWCKIPLIDTKENEKYTQKYEDGYYINVNSSTEQKQKHLYDIAEGLGLEMLVEITDGDVEIKESHQREEPVINLQVHKENAIPQNNTLIERYQAYIMRDHNENTARWYTRVLNNQVLEWIEIIVGSKKSIFDFNTLEEVSMCIEKLKASSDFMTENHRMRNFMTAALNKYYQFLQSPMAKNGI